MMLCRKFVFVDIEGIHVHWLIIIGWLQLYLNIMFILIHVCKFFDTCIYNDISYCCSWFCVDQCYKYVWFVQGGLCLTWPVSRDTGSVWRPCYCRAPPYWSKTAPPDGHHSTQQVKIPACKNRQVTKVCHLYRAHPYCDVHVLTFEVNNEIIF